MPGIQQRAAVPVQGLNARFENDPLVTGIWGGSRIAWGGDSRRERSWNDGFSARAFSRFRVPRKYSSPPPWAAVAAVVVALRVRDDAIGERDTGPATM